MDEAEQRTNSKSKILLIIAMLAAVAVILWIILSFDDQPGEQDGIGQRGNDRIIVNLEQ